MPLRKANKHALLPAYLENARLSFNGPSMLLTGHLIWIRNGFIGRRRALHCGIKVIEIYFASAIKRFPADMPRTHDRNGSHQWDISARGIGSTQRVARVLSIDSQGRRMWTLP
jgi:hypothetical protein